jgi:hypothetical protein
MVLVDVAELPHARQQAGDRLVVAELVRAGAAHEEVCDSLAPLLERLSAKDGPPLTETALSALASLTEEAAWKPGVAAPACRALRAASRPGPGRASAVSAAVSVARAHSLCQCAPGEECPAFRAAAKALAAMVTGDKDAAEAARAARAGAAVAPRKQSSAAKALLAALAA